MDQSWRPRPPIQGNICPTCSNSHFPFCPTPISFTENPRFQSNNDHFSYRPPYDPFFEYPGPTVNLHRPFVANPTDGFGDRQPWHRSPSLDRNPYSQFHGPSQIGDSPMVNGVRSDGFGPPSYDHGAVGFKRMRVNENTINPSGIAWEDERRLKLIRDHGNIPNDTNFKLNPTMNFDTKGFQTPDIGYSDSKGTTFPPNLGSYPSKYKEEDGLAYERHSILSNKDNDHHHLQRIQPSDSTMKEFPYSHPTNIPGAQTQYPMQPNHDFHRLGQFGNLRQSVGFNDLSQDGIQGQQKFAAPSMYGRSNLNEQNGYVGPTSRAFVNGQPPLPTSPPPPLPLEPQALQYFEPFGSSSMPKTPSSLFPVQVAVSSSADVTSSHSPVPTEAYSTAHNYYTNKALLQTPTGFSPEEFQVRSVSSKNYLGDNQTFPLRHSSSDRPKSIDTSHIFKQPHRATRPDRIVIILRGLPGSGKSYLAKMLRDLEVENGGDAPRIHSLDDYFMTEVEKAEESDSSKSSGSARGKKRVMKKVMEYCYEPEMEESYRSSMLKAFKKTLDEGVFSFIIVDDRNLRVADFAQFWATAKRSGYEVYLLEATYKDPVGCAARNVHSFTQEDIERMTGQWEEAPSLYLKLDIKPLLHGDDLEESGIQEVDMDTEDVDPAGDLSEADDRNLENASVSHPDEFNDDPSSKDDEKRWYGGEKGGHSTEAVKELRKSKWSDEVDNEDDDDDDDTQRTTKGERGNSSALSGLIQAYSKDGKSVRWGDQVENTGFSIGAAKREKVLSLVIGPGAGYNLKSNPLAEEEKKSGGGNNSGEWKKQNVFQEQIRAEKESFKAVFDKRRHRIGGLHHLGDE